MLTSASPPDDSIGAIGVLAGAVVAELAGRGLSLGSAESLTGGQVAAAITAVPGASAVFAGGVVAYATEVKRDVLGVPSQVVEEDGVISGACALAMAAGVRRLLDVECGLATTGVAGPAEQEGKPAGTVHVAVVSDTRAVTVELELSGDRAGIQRASVEAVLELVLTVVRGEETSVG